MDSIFNQILIHNEIFVLWLPSSCKRFIENHMSCLCFASRYHIGQQSAEQAELVLVPSAGQPGPPSGQRHCRQKTHQQYFIERKLHGLC